MRPTQESAVSLKDFAGLFIALAAVALAAIMLFDVTSKQEDAAERVSHSRAVYSDSQQLLLDCEQANSSLQSYVLTKEARYLPLYQNSKTAMERTLSALTGTTRTASVKKMMQQELTPTLKNYLNACDQVCHQVKNLPAGSLSEPSLLAGLRKQQLAADAFKVSLETVRSAQADVLDARKDRIASLAKKIDQTRTAILLVAFLAILFSIFTLRTVMKKDRKKIESLQEAVERTQEARLAASEALAEAQKSNQLKSRFMATISHEIRTPMTGILGMADLLCANNLEQPDKQYAEVLLQSSKELLTVLNDLLNFSHLERNDLVVERKPFAIRQTIKDITSQAEVLARDKHLKLTAVIDKNVPQLVQGDEEKIRRVIATLVSNSLKFTAEGGVQISVEPAANNSLKIAVIDTGIGINPEDQGKVFQPFFQVDGGIRRKFGGTGLSLTIAKHIVERMAGTIGVLSEPGAGSIFWFTLNGVFEND